MNKESFFLIFTAIGVATLGIAYGSHPNLNFLPIPFLDNININTTDISNVFSAIMGLYIAMASFWIIGAINKSYTTHALWSLVIFMTGIGGGRVISIFTDGIPSSPFIQFLVAEIIFALIGYYFLKNSMDKKA